MYSQFMMHGQKNIKLSRAVRLLDYIILFSYSGTE